LPNTVTIGASATTAYAHLGRGGSLGAFWGVIAIALGVRRLPYALQQVSVSLEETARMSARRRQRRSGELLSL
jgi:hypothetical protein